MIGVLGLIVFAGLAQASEYDDLLACYQSITEFSQGPGDDIGRWERWPGDSRDPHLRPTIAVPGMKDGREGVWIYTNQSAYFSPKPRDRDTEIFGYRFDLTLPDRHPFRCVMQGKAASIADVKARRYRLGTECQSFNREGDRDRYHPARPKALNASANAGTLKTAIQLRLGSMPVLFRRDVETYADRREAYRICGDQKGIWGALSYLGGKPPAPPLPPEKARLIRALAPCRNTEDEALRGSARSIESQLQMISVPPFSSERTCR